jgi:hypothetical protein
MIHGVCLSVSVFNLAIGLGSTWTGLGAIAGAIGGNELYDLDCCFTMGIVFIFGSLRLEERAKRQREAKCIVSLYQTDGFI